MPPKKKPEPSKKAELKKKEKVIEDKTFGLKNKKGAKNQKYIQQVQHQVKCGNISARKAEQLKPAEKKKDEKKKELEELKVLFRPVQKVEKGADPKSILCAYFKEGQCTKGDKCKFSHDLNVGRKCEKKNMYCDMRDDGDTLDKWDEIKLQEVIEKKHGESNKNIPKTDLICKHFVNALENSKYGWFWECPNGGNKCIYRHALPPGFVLKKDQKKEDKKDEISIEDLVETQRAQLGVNLTRITYESFQLWKKKKLKEKQEKNRKEDERKQAEFKAGRHVGLSGRDMFTFNPEMATDDQTEDGEAACDMISREEEECGPIKEISSEFLVEHSGILAGGTVSSVRHWENSKVNSNDLAAAGGKSDDEEENQDAIPIDENLFEDDLDELEEELQTLSVD